MKTSKTITTSKQLVEQRVPTAEDVERLFREDVLDVSPQTRKEYIGNVKLFLSFMEQNGANPHVYMQYKRYLQGTDYAISTQAKYLLVARVFLKQAYKLGAIPRDLTIGVKGIADDKGHKRMGVTSEEAERLTDYLSTLKGGRERDRLVAILSLIVLEGLRQIEVSRLDVSDLSPAEGVLAVQGKGRKAKEIVHLTEQTVTALQSYLKTFGMKQGPMFVSESNSSTGNRLTTRSVRRLITDAMQRAGIEGKTVHGWRHLFTTKHVEEYGGDLNAVARHTRHRSIETVRIYDDEVKARASLPRHERAMSGIKLL